VQCLSTAYNYITRAYEGLINGTHSQPDAQPMITADKQHHKQYNVIHVCKQPSDVELYKSLTVFHEYHVFDKASKHKVMTGGTSGEKICFNSQTKANDAGTQNY